MNLLIKSYFNIRSKLIAWTCFSLMSKYVILTIRSVQRLIRGMFQVQIRFAPVKKKQNIPVLSEPETVEQFSNTDTI